MQDFLEVMEGLGACTEGIAEIVEAGRNDHELLDVQVVVGVRAAVDHVHHRYRQGASAGTAEILEERQAGRFGRGSRNSERDT